jgi:peptidoglycan LD-endopeptidase CwlK
VSAPFAWGTRSQALLAQVHPDLRRLFAMVIERTDQDLTILPSTVRTIAEQAQFIAKGTSKTWNSRHLHGMAVDVAPYPTNWQDIPAFRRMCALVESCAADLDIPIRLGRDFVGLVDMPHIELQRAKYPDKQSVLKAITNWRRGLTK